MLPSPEVWSVPLASPAGMPGLGAGRSAREGGADAASTRATSLPVGCTGHRRGRKRGTRQRAEHCRSRYPGAGLVGPARRPGNQARGDCHLGNGIRHVIEITFDNVHFFRDNPNVPSDLEMMPHLLNFFEQNGTFLSNNHTPLIAHTADDTLTTYTGLYGDRQGMPISNNYRPTTPTARPIRPARSPTGPIRSSTRRRRPTRATTPTRRWSTRPRHRPRPARRRRPPITPAPWVPFTRAGCNVGDVSTANMDLENTAVDIPKVFGAKSPEAQQLATTLTRTRTPRPPTTSASLCTARRERRSAPTPRA